MPSTSEKQRRFFGAELGRERAGKPTKTKLPANTLKDFAMKLKTPNVLGHYSKPKPPRKPPAAKGFQPGNKPFKPTPFA